MSANLPAERQPKAQIAAGAPVAAIVPTDLDQAFRLSQALAVSGMAPRGMDKPEQIMVAIMAGAELGLAPFQALQSFAVVNGRPTLWGDGLMAVVRARGVKVKEWLDGEGEAMVAHCEATRPDTGEVIARAFSVAKAKKAGLWGKQGPWQSYPERMLQMRARALALRDGCADMLRGVQVREEVEDYTHVRDVTPRPSGLRERLTGPAGEGFSNHHAEPVQFADQAEDVSEQLDAALDGDQIPDGDTAEFVEAPATEPDADDFPGDREPGFSSQEGEFDPLAWAADLNRTMDQFETVARLNAFTDDPANIEKFEALETADPDKAKALLAAVSGRRKALAAKERG